MNLTSWLQRLCLTSLVENSRGRRQRTWADNRLRRSAVEALEDRTLLTDLIGIDFGGGAFPANWTQYSSTSSGTLNNLTDEAGATSSVSVAIAMDGTLQGGNESVSPPASEIPGHTQSLAGIDNSFADSGNVELTFSGLVANQNYDVFVFSIDTVASNQRVQFASPATPDTIIAQFNQPHAAGQLAVNDEIGDSGRNLDSYAEVVAADSSGGLLVRVDSTANPTGFFALAGIAIREAQPVAREVVIGDVTVDEDAGNAVFPVTLTTAAVDTVTLALTTADGSATAGQDYTAVTSQVTIPAGATAATATFDVPIQDDTTVEGAETFTVSVQSVVAGTLDGFADTGTGTINDDDATLTLTVNASAVGENAGAVATTGTLTRNTDTANALTVTLTSDDTSEATVPSTVTIPAGQMSVTFDIAAVDDAEVDGTKTVTVSASAAGGLSDTDTFDVTDDDVPSLVLTIGTTSVSEGDGASATTGTVTRNSDLANSAVVALSSDDVTGATVPASVTIPAGQTSVTFDIAAVDDMDIDGTQTVTITAAGPNNLTDSVMLDVTNDDIPTLMLTVSATMVGEGDGAAAAMGTVTRNTDIDNDLAVLLDSKDTTEITVPVSVTIPAGQTSVTFDIDAVDDMVFDGTQTVTIEAVTDTDLSDQVMIDVTDDDPPGLVVNIPVDAVSEGAGTDAVIGTVTRQDSLANGIVVNLQSSDLTAAIVPAAITIPAGQASATFSVSTVDDIAVDGTQTVTVSASATGLTTGTDTLAVTDDDGAVLTLVVNTQGFSEGAGSAAGTATVARNTLTSNDLIVFLSSSDTTEATVPFSVTIPAGQSSATFDISAVDDLLVDGTQSVTITATVVGFQGGSGIFGVADNDTAGLTLAISPSSVSEADGPMATTGTVTRNTDTTAPLIVSLASDDTSGATVPATVTIPAGETSATFSITAVDDAVADGTQAVTLTASAAGFDSGTDLLDVTDDEAPSVILTIASSGVSESAGAGATTATVSRNSSTTNALTVTLSSDNIGAATVPASVTIPAGQTSVTFDVDAVDDGLVDGTQTAMVTASATGHVDGTASVDVTDDDVATLSVVIAADAVSEADGSAATTGTVTRNTDTTNALTVSLSTSDATAATVVSTVTIPAGQSSATFDVDAVDDVDVDGPQTVAVVAAAPGYVTGNDTLDVTDDEVATLSVSVDDSSVSESAGAMAATATVTRNTPTTGPLTVSISSSETSAATVPASITIPAGQASASFDVAAVDDALVDGLQAAVITASANGFADGTVLLDVTDDDAAGLTLVVTDTVIGEADGINATTATVARNTATQNALVVILSSEDEKAATVPASVTIPAGQTSITFSIAAIDDDVVDGVQSTTITAAASGHTDGTDKLDVTDDDVPALTVSVDSAAVSESAGVAATFATVSRNTDTTNALTVNLAGTDPLAASVPVAVTIPAGMTSAVFDIAAVDDGLVDGTQTVTVTASANGHSDGTDTFDVTDDDTANLVVTVTDKGISENGGMTSATVTRNTDVTDPLTVTFSSSDTGEATVTGSVTIPAGQSSSSVMIGGVDDTDVDGTQTVTITVSAATHASGTATVDVTDDDTPLLNLTTAASSIGEGDGSIVGTVSRNTGTVGDLTVALSSSNPSEVTVPVSVVIPDGSSQVSFLLLAVDDGVVDGTETVTINVASSGFGSDSVVVDVIDDDVPSLSVLIAASEVSEAAGTQAATVTITRNTGTTESLAVTLDSSDISEMTVAGSAVIPAGQESVTVSIDTVDDAIVDGSQVVTVTAMASGFVAGTGSVSVTDDDVPQLTVNIDAVVVDELAGAMSTTGIVTRNSSTAGPLVVSLSSNDTTEVVVPATVTIPTGEMSVTFDVAAVDDAVFDGNKTATITATAPGHAGAGDLLTVIDDEVAALSLNVVALAINEAGGQRATTGVVTRNSSPGSALSVLLTSGDTSEVTVQSLVTIPAGQTSVSFDLDAVDDALVDGTQTVTLTAMADGHLDATDSLDVVDDDVAALTVSFADSTVSEGAGAGVTSVAVSRTTDVTEELLVTLINSNPDALTVRSTVVIPAGQASVLFPVDTVDNSIVNEPRTVILTATAADHVEGIAVLSVTDDEVAALSLTISASEIDEADGTAATTATVSRNTSTDSPLVVTLVSDDTTEVTVADTVTIPAGQKSVTFDVDAVNDADTDGTQLVTITATADLHADATDVIDVTDLDNDAVLTVSITPTGITTTDNPITFTFQFNNAVAAFDVSDVTITNGTAQKFTQVDTNVYTLSVVPLASGDVTVASSVAVDSSDINNANPSATVVSNVSPVILPPVVDIPPPVADVVRPTLSWAASDGAASYEVWFARIAPAQSRLFTSASVVTGTAWTAPEDLTPAAYRFWVRSINGDGVAGAWSRAQSFHIRPTLIGPFGNTVDSQPVFQWEAIADATGYQIFVRTRDASAGVNGDIIVSDIPPSQTSWTPDQPLPEGPIRWWIRAVDSPGNSGWSDVGLADIQLRTSVISAAANVINWTSFPNTGRYILHVQNTDNNQVVVREDNLTSTSYVLSPSLPDGNYRVWVKAIEAATDLFSSGLWSRGFDFSVGLSTTAAADDPADNMLALSPSLEDLSELTIPVVSTFENTERITQQKDPVGILKSGAVVRTSESSRPPESDQLGEMAAETDFLDDVMSDPGAIARILMSAS